MPRTGRDRTDSGSRTVRQPIGTNRILEKSTVGRNAMKRSRGKRIGALLVTACILGGISFALAQQEQRGATSYLPVDIKEPFASIMARMTAAKPDIEKAHADILAERYDLANR